MTQPTIEEKEAAIAAGEKLLDERFPGRLDRINIYTLDMEYCDRCVLGQVLNLSQDDLTPYWKFVEEYEDKEGPGWIGRRDDFQRSHGFMPLLGSYDPDDEDDDNWMELGRRWARRLEARRSCQEL